MTAAANTGHGHVRPRPDGVKARCGGPGLCSVCLYEQQRSKVGATFADGTFVPILPEVLSPFFDVDPQALAAIPPDEVPIAPTEAPRCAKCGSSPSFGKIYCPLHGCPSRAPLQTYASSFEGFTIVDDGPPAAPDVWMQALDGRAIDLVNPTADSICFKTIATVLSRIPRFGGHTRNGTYSVAQHCIEGARAIQRDDHPLLAAAAFLIHDAHEAYIGDVTTPVQKALQWHGQRESICGAVAISDAFRSLKAALDAAIFVRAGLPWPLPPHIAVVVKEYDLRMMVTERDVRLDPPPYPWRSEAQAVTGCDLWHWSEGTVVKMYEAACREMLPACAPKQADGPRLEKDGSISIPTPKYLCGNDD